MMRNIELCRYDVPTPIQAYCLPAILKGYDIIACAQTGLFSALCYLLLIRDENLAFAPTVEQPLPAHPGA